MPRCSLIFFVRLISFSVLLGMLFLLATLNMSTMLLPNNKLLIKRAQKFIAKQTIDRDWHDYKAMYSDTQRIGNGEHGKSAALSDNVDRALEKTISQKYGFNALLSDAISVNRSIPDIRNAGCLSKKYLTKLPAVSVIIPFNNEHLSVLLRTLHSIINRTPPELLQEIILVDDFSQYENLGQQLDLYVSEHFNKVQIVRLPVRVGLIRARMIGFRKATAKVLVVFDAHIEVNYNWLPPLLEPIVLNNRTIACPIVDRMDDKSFEYHYENDARGAFDWTLRYVQLKLLPENLSDRAKPYKNPIMIGGLFAINAEYFWELGGYDEELDIWGGEQYELSLKTWMCGGQVLNVPCSRVGHLYRSNKFSSGNPRGFNTVYRNHKRIIEVWMDEYKKYIYKKANGIFETIDAGNLTAQKAIRKKLHCKSFKWFLEEIAIDLLKEYPIVEPPHYAHGALQNVGSPNLCVDALNRPRYSKIGLYVCSKNLKTPYYNQKFALTWRRDLRHGGDSFTCLDVHEYKPNASVWLWECHHQGGNQFWYYDRTRKWLVQGKNGKRCLEAAPSSREVFVNNCKKNNPNMQWNFGVVNDTALDSFFESLKR